MTLSSKSAQRHAPDHPTRRYGRPTCSSQDEPDAGIAGAAGAPVNTEGEHWEVLLDAVSARLRSSAGLAGLAGLADAAHAEARLQQLQQLQQLPGVMLECAEALEQLQAARRLARRSARGLADSAAG